MPTFEIPDGPTTIDAPRSADPKNPQSTEASAVYSVTNTSSESVVGRLGFKIAGGSKEEWFTIDGDRERTFDAGETQTATIRVRFPPDVPAGDYPFRLRAVAVNDPDNDHAEGPMTTARLGGAAAIGKKSLLWLWILLGVLALLSIAAALYFLLSSIKSEPAAEKVAPARTAPAVAVPAPTPAGPPAGRVEIANLNSDLCLSPAGGGRNPNDQIVQYLCDDHPSRFWSFEQVSANVVKVVDQDNKLCLTIAGGSRDPNIAAVQYYCDDHPSRQWYYETVDRTKFRLRNLNSGLCLTIAGGSTDRNIVAVQYPCDGHPSRDWQIKR